MDEILVCGGDDPDVELDALGAADPLDLELDADDLAFDAPFVAIFVSSILPDDFSSCLEDVHCGLPARVSDLIGDRSKELGERVTPSGFTNRSSPR